MALKGKLSRLKKHMNLQPNETSPPQNEVKEDLTVREEEVVPFIDEWKNNATVPKWFEDQYTLIREVRYPIDTKHGIYHFSELKTVVEKWQDYHIPHPLSSNGREQNELLFFDTETTGLSSGAGNRIFLLGYGQVTEKEVIVRQYFLPGPEAEVAFYHHFLTDVNDMKNLVTYNGKAFDWPQVKTRHTFVRSQVPQLPKFGHYDLLHAARRLWKEQLPSCKLSIVESDILGFSRVEDTPGYLAPMLYFDFLQEQDPGLVKGIIQHHEWDILSLITLYVHMSKLIFNAWEEDSSSSIHPVEKYEIARWYKYLGEKEAAKKLYESVSLTTDPIQPKAILALAHIKKQRKEYEEALLLFNKLIDQNEYLIESAIEVSKLMEHHFKEIDQALEYSTLAYDALTEGFVRKNKKEEKLENELIKRKERLKRKKKST
ncbi:ribonuclease H-like domain-containing protein [Alkalihalophilus lindianensis]|uniref:Ribonuclease H-like domain-containing protein n=1 Tax=Alkalihalophilus lindianensis TaxID=1630542 RepID=A0ABU3X6P8_9BACI|nr:ribonuclease H-like domain-containing protein [Alkalihalophilus lindianensis]MDV2683573.1 ribonuclease H-like domain-containing protein [Alkalihalophilus lindianensis]